MRTLPFFCVGVLLATSAVLAQSNPVPQINQPLVPTATSPGSSSVLLTVNGTGFVSGSVVDWNGSPRLTTFLSTTELTATLTSTDLALPATGTVTVVNPSPGGGASNALFLTVTSPTAAVSLTRADFATGVRPNSAPTADLNGDGNLDLIIANESEGLPGTVSVLLGNGDGSFQSKVDYAVGGSPVSIGLGDFNHDGNVDLAAVNFSPNSVSILLGNGDGTFQPHVDYSGGSLSLVVGDFNGDGNLDVVVSGAVLLGNGDGTFKPAQGFILDGGAYSIATGDFNRDGKLDLALVYFYTNVVSVLLGNGDGTFQLPVDYVTGPNPIWVSAADLNMDGNLDLVLANTNCGGFTCLPGSVSVLLGNGNGTFAAHTEFSTGTSPYSLAVADYNGDGKLDLATANLLDNTLSMLLGNGDGTFLQQTTFSTGGEPFWVTAGDFNRDGRLDVAVANADDNTVSILSQAPVAGLSSNSLAFGNQSVGITSSPQTIVLTNTGSAPLAIGSISLVGSNAADFAQTNNCPVNLVAEANCSITVTFTPLTLGLRTAAVNITDNATGSPQAITLTGTGLAPVVTLSPGTLQFPTQVVGTTSNPRTVTLTNTGNATLTISSITPSGDFAQTNTCGTSVGMGASCTISSTFAPIASGVRTGAVTITDNAPNSPQSISLTGIGTVVKLSPSSLAFPTQLVGTTSPAKAVTLTNVGTVGLNFSSFIITGTAGSDFFESNTCGSSIGGGQSCTISVKFTPSAAGPRNAAVSISDDGGGSPQTVTLNGTATVVSLSPKNLNFGTVKVGKISPPKTITLTNVGATTLTVTKVSVTGNDPGDFAQVNTCSTIGPGAKCTVVVKFIPTATGQRTAAISITDNGGGSPQTVLLTGTGT